MLFGTSVNLIERTLGTLKMCQLNPEISISKRYPYRVKKKDILILFVYLNNHL
jgi:hypothetical protein